MKLVMETFLQLLIKKKYRELKDSIRMMNSKRNDTEKTNLIEEGKKNGIDEVINKSKASNIKQCHLIV